MTILSDYVDLMVRLETFQYLGFNVTCWYTFWSCMGFISVQWNICAIWFKVYIFDTLYWHKFQSTCMILSIYMDLISRSETFVICGFLFCVDTLFDFGVLITSMIHCRSQGLILQVWYNRSRCMGLIRLITLLTWTGFIIPPWNISDEIGFSHHTSWYFWSAWGFSSKVKHNIFSLWV